MILRMILIEMIMMMIVIMMMNLMMRIKIAIIQPIFKLEAPDFAW